MIDMTMAPDGSTVTELNATENVQLDLPAQGDRAGEDDQSVDACRRR